MLSNPSNGTFFCRLFQNRFTEDGKSERKLIGDTFVSFDDFNSGIIGLNDVSIKYGMGYISCNVSFPISPKFLFDAESNENSEIHKIFSIVNNWEIEFGWSGNKPNKISGMKMSKWKISYDADKRLFNTFLTLVPANGYVLGDIKILMLNDAVNELRKRFDPKTKNPTMSLGQVIALLLNASRDFIGLNSIVENEGFKQEDQKYTQIQSSNIFRNSNLLLDENRVSSRPKFSDGSVIVSDWTPRINSFSESIRVNVSMYNELFERFGKEYGLNPNMLRTIMSIESGGNYRAVSRAGAVGLMQIMPETYSQYGYDSIQIMNSETSIMVAAKELKISYDLFDGDEIKTVAAYNAGRGNVSEYNGIPPFIETVNYVEKYKYFYNKWVENDQSFNNSGSTQSQTWFTTYSSIPNVIRNASGVIQKIEPIKSSLSNIIKYATKDDIPKPEDIRVVLFSDNVDVLYNRYNAFNNEGIYNSSVMDKIANESNKDLNVLQFISQLLSDNGYMIIPRPGSVDKENGRILWMIMQSDFDNIGDTINESEFVGIGSGKIVNVKNNLPIYAKPNKLFGESITYPISNYENGVIKMFGSGSNLENSQLFDLHSNKNILLSINASTEDGESTIQSIQATQFIAQNNVEGGSGNFDYMNNIFKIMANQSKKLVMESIGFQELNPGDNIYVRLGGSLFGGRYKVLDMEHKIASNFTTNITAFRTVEGINGQKSQVTDNDPPEKVKNPLGDSEVRILDKDLMKVEVGRDKRATFEGNY